MGWLGQLFSEENEEEVEAESDLNKAKLSSSVVKDDDDGSSSSPAPPPPAPPPANPRVQPAGCDKVR